MNHALFLSISPPSNKDLVVEIRKQHIDPTTISRKGVSESEFDTNSYVSWKENINRLKTYCLTQYTIARSFRLSFIGVVTVLDAYPIMIDVE